MQAGERDIHPDGDRERLPGRGMIGLGLDNGRRAEETAGPAVEVSTEKTEERCSLRHWEKKSRKEK